MTTAVFEAHVHEIERIKALKALMLADVVMLPHVTSYARRKWFDSITKTLLPKFAGNVLTFNGRKVGFSELKKSFTRVARKVRAKDVVA